MPSIAPGTGHHGTWSARALSLWHARAQSQRACCLLTAQSSPQIKDWQAPLGHHARPSRDVGLLSGSISPLPQRAWDARKEMFPLA